MEKHMLWHWFNVCVTACDSENLFLIKNEVSIDINKELNAVCVCV